MSNPASFDAVAPKSRLRIHPDSLSLLHDLMVAVDIVLGTATGLISLLLYARWAGLRGMPLAPDGPILREILFGSLVAALILRDTRHTLATGLLILRTVLRFGLAFSVLIAIGLATRSFDDVARLWVLAWASLFLLGAVGLRLGLGTLLHGALAGTGRREAVAIIGVDEAVGRLRARLGAEADVVATFSEHDAARAEGQGGAVDRLLALGRIGALDAVVVALAEESELDVATLVERIRELPVQVAVCPDPGDIAVLPPSLRVLGGLPMSILADRPIRRWNFVVKEIIDRLGALLLGLLFLPLIGAIALLIALDTRGPVIFRQRRSGWGGASFTILKFRTMHHDGGAVAGQQTRRGDVRCTRVGRVLRRTSLDELPQLWNVLRGEMSLVGPRPHAEEFRTERRFSREIVAEYAHRRRVKPGLTGWAQVNGCRGATPTAAELRRHVELDLFYIDHWSLLLDLKILLRTPLQVLDGANAF